MKKLPYLLLLFLWPCLLSAQNSFQKSLPVNLDTAMIRCMADGSFAYIAGRVAGSSGISLFKIDGDGELVWQQNYGAGSLKLVGMNVLGDGVCMAYNKSNSNSHGDGFLARIDGNGQTVWGRRVGEQNLTSLASLATDVDGNIWVSGTKLPASNADTGFYYLMKISPDGQILDGRLTRHFYFNNVPDEVYKLTKLVWSYASNTLMGIQDFDGPYASSGISAPSRGQFSLGIAYPTITDYDDIFLAFNFRYFQPLASRVACYGLYFYSFDGLNYPNDGDPSIMLLSANGKIPKIIKKTGTVQQPVPGYHNDILFYEPATNRLIQYDSLLQPLWANRLDNCTETKGFSGEVAADGSLYAIRQIGNKSIVSRFVPGQMQACEGYAAALPSLGDSSLPDKEDDGASGKKDFTMLLADESIVGTAVTGITMDYCVRLDASFEVPDTVCAGTEIVPMNLTNSTDLMHSWNSPGGTSFDSLPPSILLAQAGTAVISHKVSFEACSDTASQTVLVLALPSIDLRDTTVCGPVEYTIDLTQASATEYLMNGQPVAPISSITQSGSYTFKISNGFCDAEKEIQVKIVAFEPPMIEAPSEACAGDTIAVKLGSQFEAITWDGNPLPDDFLVVDGSEHTYTALYSLDTACQIAGDLQVIRHVCDVVYAPNTFSPNGDGINDLFEAYATNDAEIEGMKIFDRWGGLVFESNDQQAGWDGYFNGKRSQQGVYVYLLQYFDKKQNRHLLKSGDILLLE